MDIIILLVLLAAAAFMLLDAGRPLVLSTWFAAAVLICGLFLYHTTSTLNLSF